MRSDQSLSLFFSLSLLLYLALSLSPSPPSLGSHISSQFFHFLSHLFFVVAYFVVLSGFLRMRPMGPRPCEARSISPPSHVPVRVGGERSALNERGGS